jgi:hypothetical protein
MAEKKTKRASEPDPGKNSGTENNQVAKDYAPAMPEQLKKQIADAEALRAEMSAAPEAETPAEGTEKAEAAEPAVQKAPPTEPEPYPEGEGEGSQRFRSLQGRYDQLQRANSQLVERLGQLETLIASMQARGAEPPEEHADAQPPKVRLVTDQEAEEYGDEFLSVVGKRAREEYVPEFDRLAERLKRLEGRIEGASTVLERSEKQKLYDGLQASVPNWRDVNRSEDFKTWLQQPDTYSGRRRYDMLTEAFSRHEADRVVAFFRGFLTEAAGLPTEPQAREHSAPPLPTGQGSGKKPSLEDFAAPGRARSAPQDLPPDKPTYTNAWIAKFMADKLAGKYRGREADANAIEQDIFQAQHEGRIQL